MTSLDNNPLSDADTQEDQRGRIIGCSVAILVITITVVFLRLLSRKLSRAGIWVRLGLCLYPHIKSPEC